MKYFYTDTTLVLRSSKYSHLWLHAKSKSVQTKVQLLQIEEKMYHHNTMTHCINSMLMEIKNVDYQKYPTQKSVRYDTNGKPGQLNIFVSSRTKKNFYQILLPRGESHKECCLCVLKVKLQYQLIKTQWK